MGIFKSLVNKVQVRFSSLSKELKRIREIPRYKQGQTELLSNTLTFVDSISFIHGYEEIFQDEIYNFKANNELPKIIDCGANIGLATIYFKKLYPKARLISFEPDPIIFEVLSNNIRSFGYQNVELINKAISDQNGTTTFFSEGGFSGSISNHVSGHEYEVKTQKLSEYLNEPIDFLKIDIEGAENFVIHEIAQSLESVDNIFIEYHSHIDEEQKLDEILLILKNAGFRYHILEAFTRAQPFVNRETMLGMDCQLNIIGYRA
jgi:FkbM family methyltransferase